MTKAKTIHFLETIAPGRLASVWSLTTSDPMEQILLPEYFDRYSTYGLRAHDRVMVTANMLDEAEYAWLRVVSVADGIVAVKRTDTP